MSNTGKIIGTLILFGGGAYGLSRLIQAGNTGQQISINISSLNKPLVKNGAVILSVNVVIDNPTSHTLRLKKPYLTAYYQQKEIGNSIPSDEYINIQANDRTTIKGITIQVPFLRLGVVALHLIQQANTKMAFDIHLKTEADGIPYTDQQHFEV